MKAPSLARILTDLGAFTDEPFTLIDVGCSGGIFNPALDFIPSIKAVGFDPITDEVERLQASTPDPGILFECALVGEPGWVPLPPRSTPGVFARSSAAAYSELHGFDYGREVNNQGRQIQLTERRVALRDWLDDRPDWVVDLIKVDTDGSDISVLRSLRDRLGEPLAIHVEVQFDGETGPDRNIFSTVFDTLLLSGYRLFALDASRYSKATLPRPFAWSIPAQTASGQVMQADALFCKDLAVEGAEAPTRILKLASIFDLLDLQDCAAELLEVHADALATTAPCPVDDLLVALGRRAEMGLAPVEARALFASHPEHFFPGSMEDGGRGTIKEAILAPDAAPIPLDETSVFESGALEQGWWPPEATGTWTAESVATLQVLLQDGMEPGDVIDMVAWRLDPSEGSRPTLSVVVNGVALVEVETVGGHRAFRCPLAIPPGPAHVAIHAWPLVAPAASGASADERNLGIHVSSITLLRKCAPDNRALDN